MVLNPRLGLQVAGFWLLAACSSTSMSGGSAPAKPQPSAADGATDNANAASDNQSNSDQGQKDPVQPVTDQAATPITSTSTNKDNKVDSGQTQTTHKTDTNGCPPSNQDILVLDFRSGWWSGGGGGEFFRTILGGLTAPCGGRLAIEYHHFETDKPLKVVVPARNYNQDVWSFEHADFNTYNQIWLLSGSNQDPTDLPTNSAQFQNLAQRVRSTQRGIFLGAGDGFIDHGNAFASALGLGTAFSTRQRIGHEETGPNPRTAGVLTAGRELVQHELFAGVPAITNAVNDGKRTIYGDYLTGTNVQVIGKYTTGEPVLATATANGRRVVLDAGLQRYYTINSSPSTLRLLRNIMSYLAP